MKHTQPPRGDIVPLSARNMVDRATQARLGEPGKFSGKQSGSRSALLAHFRRQTPARWQAFLQAHFASALEVTLFFDVDEKTGRNWWNGVGRPSIDKALVAQVEFPETFQQYMIAAE